MSTPAQPPTSSKPRVLVLGATGGIGAEFCRAMHRRGYAITALHRSPEHISHRVELPNIDWRLADALDRDAVMRAAEGCSVILHALNPPGYRDWGRLALPMLENTIAAAKAHGARIVLPGNVYNYGADAPQELNEATVQNAVTDKGRVRIAMERRLRAASDEGVRVLIVRAVDFYGASALPNTSWLEIMCGARWRLRLAPKGVGHSWSYLPDVAETMARLIDKEDALVTFADFMFRGHVDKDGTEVFAALDALQGRRRTVAFPWWLLRLLAFFVPFAREVMELRYLFDRPFVLRDDALEECIGEVPHTPLSKALRTIFCDDVPPADA